MQNPRNRFRKVGIWLSILVAAILVLPIWPINTPHDIWSVGEFEERQQEFEDLGGHLMKEYCRESRRTSDDSLISQYKYDINFRYGSVRGFRSILFGSLYREEIMSVAVYRACIKDGLPYFQYDHDHRHAFVTPQTYSLVQELAEKQAEQAAP